MTALPMIPAPCTEFPTLDLAQLDQAPLKPAVYLSTFEREEFTRVLGAAVRLVLTLDPRTREVVAHIAETGPAGLWDRIVNAASQWDQAGRPQPPRWSTR